MKLKNLQKDAEFSITYINYLLISDIIKDPKLKLACESVVDGLERFHEGEVI